jgi:starch phosphorylase
MTTSVPQRLRRLPELAHNLFWTWQPEARRLFSRLDPELWESTEHNPVRLLSETKLLEAAAGDADFVDAYHQVLKDFDDYLHDRETWMGYAYPDLVDGRSQGPLVAYFSAEFGLHESLPIYSGGLGVLAGDHVKSASDLGLPLVGVGLLYAQGFFRQRIDGEGWQREVYDPFHPDQRPVQPAFDPDGGEVLVTVELPGRELYLKVWRVEVGRSNVLLLDADIPENTDEDRHITARLYGGDNRTRIAQEVILGIGGVRALRAVGLRPPVYHMNEGHAAFLALERIRELVSAGSTFDEARESVARSTVFTTHTPVPAGHDAFARELFGEFAAGWATHLGTDDEGLWALGRKTEEWGEVFNMTVLAMRLSVGRNAVSAIHRDVSTEMWSYLFETGGRDDEPDPLPGHAGRHITHVTNGIHTWSWLSSHMAELYDDYSGGRAWRNAAEDSGVWSFIYETPSNELWRSHRAAKLEMVDNANARLEARAKRDGLTARELDPEALTIGFARRFATYKRATLLLADLARIKQIATDAGRPVQFVFAGKAHPADSPGKEYIQALHEAAEGELAGSLFVLEDYDMDLARRLVQGVDVWMNNPRRPLEASGTSGQKASLNGAPNFSVPDGWWPEAYNGHNGWTIGDETGYATNEEQDAADAESLYATLENEILPAYYERDAEGVPEAWVSVMREAIATVAPQFSTQRMVRDYVHSLYVPRTRQPH